MLIPVSGQNPGNEEGPTATVRPAKKRRNADKPRLPHPTGVRHYSPARAFPRPIRTAIGWLIDGVHWVHRVWLRIDSRNRALRYVVGGAA